MNRVTGILKQHVYCIIIIAVIIVISGAIIAYKTQDDALSITASIVSIVLAVVVIIYTFFHSDRSSRMTEQSERNMRETKEAVSELLHKSAKAEAILNQIQSQTATTEEVTLKPGDNLEFGLLHTSTAVEARERTVVEALGSKSDGEKVKYLVRTYVNMQFARVFEKVYGTIYGSQILLLEQLEQNRDGVDDGLVYSQYYAVAAAKYPAWYETYSYENYIGYLTNLVLISKQGEKWTITDLGLEFMTFLRTSNYLVFARERLG